MTTVLFAAILQTAVLGAEPVPVQAVSYAEARKTVTKTGQPMVVMVSTDWCPPCQVMKKTIMPSVSEHGLLKRVAFAIVNPDRDGKLAEELIGGGPIPQLLMFRKTSDGWVRNKLIGGQSVETVEEFISDGLTSDEQEKKPSKPADKVEPPPPAEGTTDDEG